MSVLAARSSTAPRTTHGGADFTARSSRPLLAPEPEAYADDFARLVDPPSATAPMSASSPPTTSDEGARVTRRRRR